MSKVARKLIPVVVLGLAAVSACSGGPGPDDGEASTEFTYWSMYLEGEPMQEVLATAIEDFEAETDIIVNVQWQGRDNIQRTVPTLMTSTVPDLVDGPYTKIYPGLVASGQAKGLEDAWNSDLGDDEKAKDVVPARYLETIDIMNDDEQPWMVPISLTSDAIWFNAATHPELKDQPPATWDDFIALLDKLKANGETPIALDADIPKYNAYWFTTILLRNLGPRALYKLASDETGESWHDPEVLDAAQKVQQLVDGGYFIDGYNASKFPSQQQKWASGEAALLFMGTWAPVETESYATEGFEFASFPFPETNGDYFSARADFLGFSVPTGAKHADAAQEFAAYVLADKYQQMTADADLLPIRDGISPPEVQTSVSKHLEEADGFHQENDGVAFPGYNAEVFWAVNDDLVLGKMDAQTFVDTMAQETADYWKSQG